MKRAYLDGNGTFVVADYNQAKPFANFFPGIAGEWGIPMWAFYVNRGQAIASFGIESKDKAIMEFQPANKAYRLTPTHGFRTFLKVSREGKTVFYEPFQSAGVTTFRLEQTMKISSHELTIEETNKTLGIAVEVTYFTVPEEPFAALVRQVRIRNLSRKALSVEMIDGLPVIMPYGQNEWVMKHMCRTIEAWYKVRNLDKKAPYFQLEVEAADVPQVKHIEEGNFYFAFDPNSRPGKLFDPVVDVGAVFGQALDLRIPEAFLAQKRFSVPEVQQTDNRTPCAMMSGAFSLKSGAEKSIVSVIGFVHSVAELQATIRKMTTSGYIDKKRARNRTLIEGIKALSLTKSSSSEFDAYCGQTFLDNVLRGGLPVSLRTAEGPAVFNVYSRKHGDLERDYNQFRIAPTFLSQGNGNYRDVNQNRRNDVWFNPDLKESAVVNFLSLVQADGYNPLVVCGMMFVAEDVERIDKVLTRYVKGDGQEILRGFLMKGFMPGDLFQFILANGIKLKCSAREFLGHVLAGCQKHETAQHGEGFWTDHWAYNLDLVESYLALHPEDLRGILLERKAFTFYHNHVYVLPRDKRYILTGRGVRQYHSLHEGPEEKDASKKLRVRGGQGEVYQATLLVKLLCLIANKAATFDPSGVGIEMEANKPNWYDSLNGLPGLIGSSISETFELKRFSSFVLDALGQLAVEETDTVEVYAELASFLFGLSAVMATGSGAHDLWKKTNDLKEAYRARVRAGIQGEEEAVAVKDIRIFLEQVVQRCDQAVQKSRRKDGLFPTYFYHRVTKYEYLNASDEGKEEVPVRPLEFERHDLPLFLEGFVHALRSEKDTEEAARLHHKVRSSALFDKALGMYKVNASILSESEEIGRTRIFPRGWLENESIWLHMEYKYLLELLRRGLHQEFYRDLQKACVAFMDPEVYGRSILENSSFIASSAHRDRALHGQGFVARLSGSTAEWIHIWMFMNAGLRPFRIDHAGRLELVLDPVLKGELFTRKAETILWYERDGEERKALIPADSYAFHFMGKTLVVYHNKSRRDTFGPHAARPVSIRLRYVRSRKDVVVPGGTIPSPYAGDVREGQVARIDVEVA
ncbi:MAG: hypothetical protein GX606_06635 [Elusimicrobia bacterium]|nr:hypothetical protein [Elusimicrobiota bacterium]